MCISLLRYTEVYLLESANFSLYSCNLPTHLHCPHLQIVYLLTSFTAISSGSCLPVFDPFVRFLPLLCPPALFALFVSSPLVAVFDHVLPHQVFCLSLPKGAEELSLTSLHSGGATFHWFSNFLLSFYCIQFPFLSKLVPTLPTMQQDCQ